MSLTDTPHFIKENFSELLSAKMGKQPKEKTIVQGNVVNIVNDMVFVDIGTKSEGRIPKNDFSTPEDISVGKQVDVYIERLEDKSGCTQLSISRVRKEKIWQKFEESSKNNLNITGTIIGRVSKGGFAVEIDSVLAFLPGSQLDVKQIIDPSALFNTEEEFRILKLDRQQGNIVVSRRAVIEDSRKDAREKLLSNITEGTKLHGVVKNMTPYGAFIDLGDIDGLLHITDICWSKISHPTEKLKIGEKIEVIVTRYNSETQRVSLGMKQLSANPWAGMKSKYIIGQKYQGNISEFCEYGIFVELEKNVKGLVYINEISWNTKNINPNQLYKLGDEIETEVMDIDIEKHRLSLSIKRCSDNPWEIFSRKYNVNDIVKSKVIKILDFGLLVNVIEDKGCNNLNLLVPAIEINWDENPKKALKNYKIGDTVEGIIYNKDLDRERITISIKRHEENKIKKATEQLLKAKAHTCKVIEVNKEGLLVELICGTKGFIKRYDLSKHKDQQIPERFTVGDRLDAKPLFFSKDRILSLSVKILELKEEKENLAKFGSVHSGAMLGDILGAAIEDHKKNN